MRPTICLMILMLCLPSCAGWRADIPPPEGKAAAILDAAQTPAQEHAAALTGEDVQAMRRTGLKLITLVRCWVDDCDPA